MRRSERAYRALLRAYPARTRDASGEDMTQLFMDRLRDATSTREIASIWLEAIADVAATAPREHLVARRSRQLVEGPALLPKRVPMKRDAALASLPLAAALVMVAVQPFDVLWGAMYATSPGLFGMPLGMGILVMLAALASIGLLAVRRNRELNDPWHQAILLMVLLAPAPALALIAGVVVASLYALGGTLFLLVARYRLLMLALMMPMLAWMIVGPLAMGIIAPFMQALGEAP